MRGENKVETVEWLRRDCTDASVKAPGRVMPALLAIVHIQGRELEEVDIA